ncbi:hypothetical protein [Nostoc sp.]|uniref:hypothetical protein n=1 Tax=Nostoc sp. TaxID=1180 RepID=UPI002FFA3F6B
MVDLQLNGRSSVNNDNLLKTLLGCAALNPTYDSSLVNRIATRTASLLFQELLRSLLAISPSWQKGTAIALPKRKSVTKSNQTALFKGHDKKCVNKLW